MDIKKAVHDNADKVIQLRRRIHQYPELSMKEYETTKLIARVLQETGIPFRLLEPTGVIAQIDGKKSGKTVALRADIDALPIVEKADVIYKSNNEGAMHACGHDVHTAMLLGAAKVLNDVRNELSGSVRLIFQPGEETGQGANAVIAQGGISDVDLMFGIHIICPLKKNIIMCSRGASHASSDTFKIEVYGKQTHAASPHSGSDALLCAAYIVTELQSLISREVDPMEPAVVSVGTFMSGTAENIIPGSAVVTGTVRTTNMMTHEKMPEMVKRIAQSIAAAHHCEAVVEYNRITQVVMNDPLAVEIGMGAAKKVTTENVICKGLRTLGGEDFGAYTEYTKAAFFSLGAGGVGPMHGEKFEPDEGVLETGTALYVQMAIDALNCMDQETKKGDF